MADKASPADPARAADVLAAAVAAEAVVAERADALADAAAEWASKLQLRD